MREHCSLEIGRSITFYPNMAKTGQCGILDVHLNLCEAI